MPRVVRRPFGFGGKLLVVILLSIIFGFGWAMHSTGRTFTDVANIFSPGDGGAVSQPPPPPRGPLAPPDSPGKPHATEPKVTPPAPDAPVPYSSEMMTSLFEEIDGHLKRGRIKEARELIGRRSASLVPTPWMEQFRRREEELAKYHQLLRETGPGAAIDLPETAEVHLKSGGTLVVKNLQESATDVRFETLTGIRGSVRRGDVVKIEKRPRDRSGVLVDEELERQASYRGILVAKEKTDAGIDMKFSDKAGASVPGYAYFELADFCARNGRNSRLVPLFDEALKRDSELVGTVFEKKAGQFVDIFLYFIATQAKEDARNAYVVLSQRYRNSRAFRENVEGDEEVRKAYADLFDTELAKGPKPGTTEPGTRDKPPEPEPEADLPPPIPPPTPGPPPPPPPPSSGLPDPEPPKKKPPVVEEDPDLVNASEPTILPPDSPSKAVELVKKGDDLFKQGMKHVLNSDSTKNPEGWIAENKKALKFLTEALEKCYYPAQEVFEKAKKPVPRTLMKRFRHCQMAKVACRKRDVGSR